VAERTCEECGAPLTIQRKRARFCRDSCRTRWHNKQPSAPGSPRKRLTAAREPENGLRRKSKDGLGTRVYLTETEIVLMSRAAERLQRFGFRDTPEVARLRAKLARAANRIRPKRLTPD
jgi:hypothetical protein